MDGGLRAQAIAIHDRFTSDHGDRGCFPPAPARFAAGVAVAQLVDIDPAAAIAVKDDARVGADRVDVDAEPGRVPRAYRTIPALAWVLAIAFFRSTLA